MVQVRDATKQHLTIENIATTRRDEFAGRVHNHRQGCSQMEIKMVVDTIVSQAVSSPETKRQITLNRHTMRKTRARRRSRRPEHLKFQPTGREMFVFEQSN